MDSVREGYRSVRERTADSVRDATRVYGRVTGDTPTNQKVYRDSTVVKGRTTGVTLQ